jgi:lipopolysaccharide export LptBFGC system permease protein LptF
VFVDDSAERVLFAGTFGDPAILWGFVAALATAALGLWVGIRSIRTATSSRAMSRTRTRRVGRERGRHPTRGVR